MKSINFLYIVTILATLQCRSRESDLSSDKNPIISASIHRIARDLQHRHPYLPVEEVKTLRRAGLSKLAIKILKNRLNKDDIEVRKIWQTIRARGARMEARFTLAKLGDRETIANLVKDLNGGVLGREQIQKLISALRDVAKIGDVTELNPLLQGLEPLRLDRDKTLRIQAYGPLLQRPSRFEENLSHLLAHQPPTISLPILNQNLPSIDLAPPPKLASQIAELVASADSPTEYWKVSLYLAKNGDLKEVARIKTHLKTMAKSPPTRNHFSQFREAFRAGIGSLSEDLLATGSTFARHTLEEIKGSALVPRFWREIVQTTAALYSDSSDIKELFDQSGTRPGLAKKMDARYLYGPWVVLAGHGNTSARRELESTLAKDRTQRTLINLAMVAAIERDPALDLRAMRSNDFLTIDTVLAMDPDADLSEFSLDKITGSSLTRAYQEIARADLPLSFNQQAIIDKLLASKGEFTYKGKTYPRERDLGYLFREEPEQQQFGSCHVHASVSLFEAFCMEHLGLDLNISEEYLFYRHIRYMLATDSDKKFDFGGPSGGVSMYDGVLHDDIGRTVELIMNGSVCLEDEYRAKDTFLSEFKAWLESGRTTLAHLSNGAHRAAFRKAYLEGFCEMLDRTADECRSMDVSKKTTSTGFVFKSRDADLRRCIKLSKQKSFVASSAFSWQRALDLLNESQPFTCGYAVKSYGKVVGNHVVLVTGYHYDPSRSPPIRFHARNSTNSPGIDEMGCMTMTYWKS